MSYLDRLKRKISEDAPEAGATKATKGAFVPFVATPSAPLRQIHAVNDVLAELPRGSLAGVKVSPANTARGWLVRYPDGGIIETYVHLADGTYPTRGEVLRDYPGAIDAEPIPGSG
ncbi:MAG: hypothetical protein KF766_03700 [Rhodocyclaceae bacterium]|nr:hypothetical protein [Rhodocyclaceae bacterium]